jgi:hypothetical protein
VPTKRSAIAFAFADRTGVLITRMLSLAKTVSKSRVNLLSRPADHEAEPWRLLLQYPGELASLLGDPRARGVGGAVGEMDAAAAMLDEEEDVETPEGDRVDGEEVDGEHASRLLPQECPPGQAGTLFGRSDALLAQDLADGGRRHLQAESVDLAGDPLVAPARVFAGERSTSRRVSALIDGRPVLPA